MRRYALKNGDELALGMLARSDGMCGPGGVRLMVLKPTAEEVAEKVSLLGQSWVDSMRWVGRIAIYTI